MPYAYDNLFFAGYSYNQLPSGISANVAIGDSAQMGNVNSLYNTAIGYRALQVMNYSNSGVPYNGFNVAVGGLALNTNQPTASTNGIYNVAVGVQSLANNTC